MTNIKRKAIETLIDFLNDNPDFYQWDDLHHYVFNESEKYIYTYDAIADLDEFGTWDAIEEVKDYEMFNFGELYTDLSSPVGVANMIFYIIGEEILMDIDLYDICYEKEEDSEVRDEIMKAAKETREAA